MTDKNTNQQVLGCLIHNPLLLAEVDKYRLSLMDFSTRFEKYIFTAISGLFNNGAEKIEPIDIANFLDSDATATTVFETNHGIEYLQDIMEFSNVENFDYYYNKLKKINLLRDLKKQGIDTSMFYCEDLADSKADEINKKFEHLTTQEICDAVKRKVLNLEENYAKPEEVETFKIAENLREFIEEQKETVSVGLPIQGELYNKIIGGAEKGALTIRSGSSGVGKTRQAVGDACYLAYPIRYNSRIGKWEQTGNCEKVLFVITEQRKEEIMRFVVAYLSDVNEANIRLGNYTANEGERIDKAISIAERYIDNFICIKMPNPTISLVKTTVRKNVFLYNVEYVFYDYIFIGPALLSEFKGFALRNDEVLLMFATALKDLAVELNVSVFTSTQVSAKADDNTKIRNEGSLAGGRATINKADNGAIMARPAPEELETLQPVIDSIGLIPNIVTDIFKVRNGQWSQIRLWSCVDLGRMRKIDLFVTDERLNVQEEITKEPVIHWDLLDEIKPEVAELLEKLNA